MITTKYAIERIREIISWDTNSTPHAEGNEELANKLKLARISVIVDELIYKTPNNHGVTDGKV